MARVTGAVYNGLIWACLATVLCVNSVVICMKVNMGTLFLAVFAGGALLLWGITFLKGRRAGALFSLVNLVVCILAAVLVYQFIYGKDLLTRPAFILRLALHRQVPSQNLVNGVLLAAALLGYLAVLLTNRLTDRREQRKKRPSKK